MKAKGSMTFLATKCETVFIGDWYHLSNRGGTGTKKDSFSTVHDLTPENKDSF